jgi:hypothetical protein
MKSYIVGICSQPATEQVPQVFESRILPNINRNLRPAGVEILSGNKRTLILSYPGMRDVRVPWYVVHSMSPLLVYRQRQCEVHERIERDGHLFVTNQRRPSTEAARHDTPPFDTRDRPTCSGIDLGTDRQLRCRSASCNLPKISEPRR